MRAALLSAALAVTLAGQVRAESARIVIVSLGTCCPDESWPEAEQITRAEFAALDFEVQVVPGLAQDEKERREELMKLAQQNEAAAALRIVREQDPSKGGVELWVMDRVTGKMVFRKLAVDWRANGEAASIVALRVVELLSASLLEIHGPAGQHGEVEPAPQVITLVESVEPGGKRAGGAVGIRMGVAALGSPLSTGALGAFGLAISVSPIRQLGLELDGLISFAGKDVDRSGASSTFNVGAVRGWILWRILAKGVVRPVIGVGGGVLLPWARGLDQRRKTDRTATGYVGATARLGLALSKNIWMRALFNVGFSVPETRIFFADSVVETFGIPLLEGGIFLEVRIP